MYVFPTLDEAAEPARRKPGRPRKDVNEPDLPCAMEYLWADLAAGPPSPERGKGSRAAVEAEALAVARIKFADARPGGENARCYAAWRAEEREIMLTRK
jgi:hypothetical protein